MSYQLDVTVLDIPSNYRGVGYFGAKFANLVHRAAVAPMQNARKSAGNAL